MSSGYRFTERSNLDRAVDLWISDEASATRTYGHINTWNVSAITDFSYLFNDFFPYGFNSDISDWDVSNGTDFSYMFFVYGFNQDISSWDVSSGTNFSYMFAENGSFNQDISTWDVSSGINFRSMFSDSNIRQDLSLWNCSSVGNDGFYKMFAGSDSMQGDGWSITPSSSDFLGQTLTGTNGADALYGGKGNDIYIVDHENDIVYESYSGGSDLVKSSLNYTLGENVENLTLTGSIGLWGYGNELDNVIKGTFGDDYLSGFSGSSDNYLNGSGEDTLIGRDGSDIYGVDSNGDEIIENLSEGYDSVASSVSYILPDNVERLWLSGNKRTHTNGTGNNIDNEIYGTYGNNTLSGKAGKDILNGYDGNDILNGGFGNDRLVGGAGSDTAVFSSRNNRVNLASIIRQNTRDGRDIFSSIENVKGGRGNDFIFGNATNNYLYGEKGNDRLYGKIGNDKLFGGAGNDKLFGQAGNDLLTGGLGKNQLKGGAGKDKFCITAGTGRDFIKDYTSGEDKIKLPSDLTESDLTIRQVRDNVKIKYEGDLMAILQDTLIADLTFI